MTTKNALPAFLAEILQSCSNPAAPCMIEAKTGRTVTYKEFHEIITKTIGYLKGKNVPRDSFVMINLPLCPEYPAIEYGAWLYGCGVVPSGPQYPKERQEFMARDCEASLIIDTDTLSDIRRSPKSEDFCPTSGTAILFYTSGSTGKPKGVMHSFEPFKCLDQYNEVVGDIPGDTAGTARRISPSDRFAFGAPMSFVASVLPIAFFKAGACVVLLNREEMTDTTLLTRQLKKYAVTCAFLSPSILKQIKLDQVSTLRTVITGSEQVAGIKSEGYRLVNAYGMTETLGPRIFFTIDKVYSSTPVGVPSDGIEAVIIGDDSTPVPDGQEGELCLKGTFTTGYFKDKEKTEELFRDGWLHTGDMARRLPDGNLQIVGRRDWMVKINGQRVEVGEISAALRQIDGVKDAIAKGFTAPDGRQYIVAYYVPAASAEPATDITAASGSSGVAAATTITEAAIRESLSRNLPVYMVPSFFVKMKALPVNTNGKVAFKELQSPLEVGIDAKREVAAPQNEVQKRLCEVFEQALGISPIGMDDDFFAFGGDSVRVMKAQSLFPGEALSADMIYRLRTPRAIENEISGTKQGTFVPTEAKTNVSGTKQGNSVPTEAKTNVSGTKQGDFVPGQERYPLSAAQTGIFVECMKRRGEAAYNNPLLYRLPKDFDAQRLAEACTATIRAHSGLSARFGMGDDGVPYQIPATTATFQAKVEAVSDAEFETIRQNLIQPFDILNDTLFRIRIFKTPSAVWMFQDFHHIVFDGTSNQVIINDIEKAFNGGQLKEEKTTPFDIAVRERELRDSRQFEQCRKWYLDKFADAPGTSLPPNDISKVTAASTSNATPTSNTAAAPTKTFAKFDVTLPLGTKTFETAAQTMGVSENILSIGAFAYVAGACCRAQRADFATIYNGRKDAKVFDTVGMLVKTLPLSAKWSKTTTVGEFLQELRRDVSDAMAYDLYPFSELCAKTLMDSRLIFTYQASLLEKTSLCGAPCEFTPLVENATGEPLTMQLFKDGNSLKLRVEYRSDMFSEGYMQRFASSYCNTLGALCSSQISSRLCEVSLLSADQTKEIIDLGRGETLEYDHSKTVVDLFQDMVKATPEAIAVADEHNSLTFKQLDQRSDTLAAALVQNGVKKDDFVAIMLDRTVDFPTAFLAVFKCGAAYVPMDSEYPDDRIAYMLSDSGAKLLITAKGLLQNKKIGEANVFTIDGFNFDPAATPLKQTSTVQAAAIKASPFNHATPSGLAYMIYTSGTTGKPKGVMIEHSSLMNAVQWYAKATDAKPGAHVAHHSSFSFDGSITDLMTPLSFGEQLHIIPSSIRKDLKGLYDFLTGRKIEGLLMTTQLGVMLMNSFDLKLRWIIVGGEKLSSIPTKDTKVINAYGPTEFTVASSYYVLPKENIPENIPIGRPVANTISAIVDAEGNLVPRGVPGELVLIGPQLSRGYLNRPETTAEHFVPCPFIGGQKMYRTGDLARWSEDGNLLYMGRIDTQVKLRGFRIELGEIESAMAQFPSVKSPVAAVKEIAGLQHLCAYYCSDSPVDEGALKAFLEKSLTSYMVPTAFVRMDAMPLTPNGKVDVKNLPLPQIKAEEIVPPETDAERRIFEVASAFLKTDGFGVTTNLISMGMTSLGALGLSLELGRKAGIDIPSSAMLEHPTVREWAKLCQEGEVQQEQLQPYPPQEDYPLTENQMGIYIDWEMHRDATNYNLPLVVAFEGVSPQKVEKAVRLVEAAHPYLRTHLSNRGGAIRQIPGKGALEIVKLKLLSKPKEDYFRSLVRPYDLLNDDLTRFAIIEVPGCTFLFLDIHHIIFDGGSLNILLSQINDAVHGEAPVPETLSALDYALYSQDWKQSEQYAKAQEHFDALLEGCTSADICNTEAPAIAEGGASSKAGASLGAESTQRVGTIGIRVPREGIRNLCRSVGVTENAFFLVATSQVLHRLSREDDICLETVSSGRSLRGLEGSVGMFVQTLPFVSHQKPGSISQALSDAQKQMAASIGFDKYPFTAMVERHSLKANVMMVYQGDVLASDVKMQALELGDSKFPVSIEVTPSERSVQIKIEYDRTLRSDKDAAIFAAALEGFVLECAGAAPETLLKDVSCVTKAAAEKIIATGRGTSIDVNYDDTIVKMFRRHVAAAPEKVAVADCDGSITYGELDAKSDSLAAELLRRGVQNDDFVALMLPRRILFPIAYMACFKSGAAYVPMDSEYPSERLSYMLENSEAKVLVTTRELFEAKSAEGELKAADVLLLDEFDFKKEAPVDKSRPDGLAYMIYTSGTTGKPKGVMLEHHCLTNLISWFPACMRVDSASRFTSHVSFSFDASVPDLMSSLGIGAELYIMSESVRKDPITIYNYLVDNKIDTLTISTQMGLMLLDSFDLPLRSIMLGGEKFTGKYKTNTVILNGYGPTEFTVCSSYYAMEGGVVPDNVPIGRAVPNTISAIVDSFGNLVPDGAPGELVLVGPQLARGYWHRDDVTAERFVSCPFISGEKMYRTGDLARWSEDGELLYMGRIDTQVKLRGFRIEMGEIESTLSSFAGVKSAIAEVKEVGGVQHLCAYYTSAEPLDEGAMKAHLAASLTEYMVPDYYMRLEEFPLTPNGKVNRKVLPVPEARAEAPERRFEAPEGEVETAIASAFEQALGCAEGSFDRNTSFFEMGGTSLLVMKAVVRLSEASLSATYGDIFKYPTPRTLAAFLDGLSQAASGGSGEGGASDSAADSKAGAEASDNTLTGPDGFDYSAVREALKSNSVGSLGDLKALREREGTGDTLLLGATGYLGIHILRLLIDGGSSKIWCMVRPNKDISAEGRLKALLMYYFDNTWSELFGQRIFVIEGDLTDEDAADKLKKISVDTVINCAANVKHFAAGDQIENINLNGAKKLVDYCLATGARMVQTSTQSISGCFPAPSFHTMLESDLYFGQELTTKYQQSKFLSERALLDAISRGLRGKVMRLGNLMPRYSDGEFQINLENNGFMTRMRAYYLIGCVASSHLHTAIEFAPIDETASAILTLACTPDRFTVFHPFNNHTIYLDDVVAIMRKQGLAMDIVDDQEFGRRLDAALKDESLSPYITTLLAYGGHSDKIENPASTDFTVNVLNAMDWRWSMTGERYLSDAIAKMKSLEFFDRKNLLK